MSSTWTAACVLGAVGSFTLMGCGDAPAPTPAPTPAPYVKPICEVWFGDMTGKVTIVDNDVGLTNASSGYCDSNDLTKPCTYIHWIGGLAASDISKCIPPGPPDGCHRYRKITYTDACDMEAYSAAPLPGSLYNWNADTSVFNEHGVLTACADKVEKTEISLWGPPASHPVACELPEPVPTPVPTPAPTPAPPAPYVKPICEVWFGDMTGKVTIVDNDVGLTDASSGYCDSNDLTKPCTYIHWIGGLQASDISKCIPPGPPDGCHQYRKITYTDECNMEAYSAAPLPGSLYNWNANTSVFNEHGVLTACADKVLLTEIRLWGPPASHPVNCELAAQESVPGRSVSV